ncbi:MAG: 23S rRNA (guanosine(2251)-2'-O)-methyltransferase RlmB [Deltaproteobacteria bacterium]|nr:23S rRNA (guanosine(2251)-2'-O)-methyltransferase RlmB [Deltaproteobacteria bacterium]
METIKSSPQNICEVFATKSSLDWLRKTSLSDKLAKLKKPILEASKDAFEQAVPGLVHQGVVTTLNQRRLFSLKELIQISARSNASGIIVALDELQDPQNMGAVLRVAECGGVDGVIGTKRRSVGITPAVAKASAGASETMPISLVTNLNEALKELKNNGFWIIGTDAGKQANNLFETKLPSEPIVLVFGSEGKGLRRLVKEHCDIMLKIPLMGKIESLNVSQAASILLFEALRQRAFSSVKAKMK